MIAALILAAKEIIYLISKGVGVDVYLEVSAVRISSALDRKGDIARLEGLKRLISLILDIEAKRGCCG